MSKKSKKLVVEPEAEVESDDDSEDENPLLLLKKGGRKTKGGEQVEGEVSPSEVIPEKKKRSFVMTEKRAETLAKGRAKRAENVRRLQALKQQERDKAHELREKSRQRTPPRGKRDEEVYTPPANNYHISFV